MILLIDNYDSFSYNLYQIIGNIKEDILVIKNDELTLEEIEKLEISHIVISPGPGKPEDSGICKEVIKRYYKEKPIIGICLGHQCIYEIFGGIVTYAKEIYHGKKDKIKIKRNIEIFKGLEESIDVGRYHSLSGTVESLPKELVLIGEDKNGEVMGVKHKDYNVYGLQFHPESILTSDGTIIIKNFLNMK